MKYFLDTEFYEDGTTIDLISIALVAEDGREFYAVSQDAQLHRVSSWVRENVLTKLPKYGDPAWMTRRTIRDRISQFVLSEETERHEFWGYYADYDWVVLCQLFGSMMNLPKRFPMFCRDLKQLSIDVGSPEHPADPTDAHNALADARWVRDLYWFLMERKHDSKELLRQREVLVKTVASARQELVTAYQDWDKDRDAKVGKRISNVCEILKAIK
jgi:hypothetical protein